MLQKKYLLGGVAVFAALLFSVQVFAQVDKAGSHERPECRREKAIRERSKLRFATVKLRPEISWEL
jgi:hypothetical protein